MQNKKWNYAQSVEFGEIVAEMREQQKLYFKYRTSNYFDASKRLERNVDRLILQYGLSKPDQQQKLL